MLSLMAKCPSCFYPNNITTTVSLYAFPNTYLLHEYYHGSCIGKFWGPFSFGLFAGRTLMKLELAIVIINVNKKLIRGVEDELISLTRRRSLKVKDDGRKNNKALGIDKISNLLSSKFKRKKKKRNI